MRNGIVALTWSTALLFAWSGMSGCGKKDGTPAKDSPAPTEVVKGKDAKDDTEKEGKKPTDPPAGKSTVLAAKELINQFRADWPTTDKKFDGQWLEIEGVVDSVNRIVTHGEIIVRGSEEPAELLDPKIRCEVSAEQYAKAASTLSEGQKIKVKGMYKPSTINVFVFLTKGEYTELSPSTLKKFTSDDLAKQVAKDRDAVRKELGSQEFVVSGKVKELEHDVFSTVELEASGPIRIIGRLIDKKEWEGLKKGQEVRIRGHWSPLSSEKDVQVDFAFVLSAK